MACQVHDLIPLIMPEQYLSRYSDPLKEEYHRRLSFVAHGNLLLCDSEATARDVMHYLKPRGRVAVTYLPVDGRFRPIPREQAIQTMARRLRLTEPYVCTVNAWDYRKNNPGIITGFAAAALPQHQLVFAGIHDEREQENLNALARRHGIGGRLLFAPFLTTEVLNCLYCGADLTLFPSLYEGFGLPVLESLSCGVPVVAGNNSALPEVLGDAGLLVDARDPQAIGSAIRRIVMDTGLRALLAGKAFQQTTRFAQERVADRLRSALLPHPFSTPRSPEEMAALAKTAVTSEAAVPDPSLQAELAVDPTHVRRKAGDMVSIRLHIRNTGAAIWMAPPGPDCVEVAADLRTFRGKEVVLDYWRRSLPHNVPPGGAATINVTFAVPTQPAAYILDFDLVHRTRGRFARHGCKHLMFKLVTTYPEV